MKTNFCLPVFIMLFISANAIAQNNFDDKWITYFEKSNYMESPDYDETMNYFQQFADESEFVDMKTFGISPQGRKLKYLIVSVDKAFTPESAIKLHKPVILLQNGIHSGEIEGKEASMLLLREMLITKEKSDLLKNVVFLVVPIFNVDGHERRSPYGRINQNGPDTMGWRVTAQNLNLNRDYMKADTPEMRAMLGLYNSWLPDIYIDSHTTDGADYQYTVTYITDKNQNLPEVSRKWVREKFIPAIIDGAESRGFLISPYVYFEGDLNSGINNFVSTPRFSTGFASAQNRTEVTIETHMLKPFKERVFSTKAVIEGILELANREPEEIVNVSRQADIDVVRKYSQDHHFFPIKFKTSKDVYDLIEFKGFKKDSIYSEISGSKVVKYTDEKLNVNIPYYYKTLITDSVEVPKYYLVPKEWKEIIELLKVHGIEFTSLDKPTEFNVERYKFKDISFASKPYEGRFIPDYSYNVYTETVEVPAGTIIINPAQRRLGIIMYLLEPKSADSFVGWGLMNQIFERKEYFETYSMEPIAAQMYNRNPELKKEFLDKISSDDEFKNNPRARLNFFYERSKYYDAKYNVYPIMRVID